MTNARTLLLTGALALSSQVLPADVDVEYIAHACFVVTSSEGTRVVIDPYNSSRWLGYHFPDSVEADVVLVTHPHYDHDASYYWGDSTPVFREPGSARVGDVELLGESPAMDALRTQIARFSDTPFPVLIQVESGTGK